MNEEMPRLGLLDDTLNGGPVKDLLRNIVNLREQARRAAEEKDKAEKELLNQMGLLKQMRILEAKLMRLQVENRKLNERVAKLEAAAPKPIMDDVFKGGLLGGIGHYTKEQLEEGAKYYGTIRLGGGNDTPDERDTTHDL